MAHSCRALGARLAASHAIPAASRWRREAFTAWLRLGQAKIALFEAQNKAKQARGRRSAAPHCGQYSAKVGVLGSAIALPNPFFIMRKGPEEV